MRDKIRHLREARKNDYQFSTFTSSAASALINVAFMILNGVLGVGYHSLWYGSICVYYLLLPVIRTTILSAQRKDGGCRQEQGAAYRRKIYLGTHRLLLLMDVALIVPIRVMVKDERSYTYGLIPAIAMAAYTTHRMTMSVIHFLKSKKSDNLLVSQLRMINLTDALLALLTLQNALIIANGGMNSEMKTLAAWTSAGVFVTIVFITIKSFLKIQTAK